MSLKIDNRIPYFNASVLSVNEEKDITEINFSAEPHGGPECLWFCFRLKSYGTNTSQKVKLVLQYVSNMLGGNNPSNMRPVVKYENKGWERLDTGIVEVLRDGRKRVVWFIESPESFVDVAYCYPYGMTEIEQLLKDTDGYWQADNIGVSQKGQPLIRLSNHYGKVKGNRPGLFLISRQHSGETPGSWILDGFLRHIASLGDSVPLVWAIPLANIDGIEEGDYGKDNFPYDLNRAWGNPPMRHEVLVFQRDIQRWKSRCNPVLAIDFHAPGACESEGIYCFLPNPDEFPQKHKETLQWTNAIKDKLTSKYAAKYFNRVATYSSRWETPNFSKYFYDIQDICGFTVETPYALIGDLVLTRGCYREAGKLIASAVIENII